jgi:hypothetical protein
MQSNGSRIVALLVALAVIVALFFAFRGGDDDDSTTATEAAATTTTTTGHEGGGDREHQGNARKHQANENGSVPTIEVVGGKPKGGVAELEFDKGEEIRFAVTSDTADEVHVHGYDVEGEIEAGGTAEFGFPADLEGVFEVELHHSGGQIAELTINP